MGQSDSAVAIGVPPTVVKNLITQTAPHFLMLSIIHVSMVAATGLLRNMNHITVGTDNTTSPAGLYWGASQKKENIAR